MCNQVEGENHKFGYVLENGLVKTGQNPEIAGVLDNFEGTVFPQGSIHFQFNDNCEKATFVATLNSEDPSTSQVAQNLFFSTLVSSMPLWASPRSLMARYGTHV